MLCPYCNSIKFAKINTKIGTEYGIIEVNAQTKNLHLDSVLPVDLYGCLDCKGVMIKCESLKVN